MQTLVERGCGLDVPQATVVACLLIVLKDGKVRKQMRTFGTTTRELLSLREWLLSEGYTHVAMEGLRWPRLELLSWSFQCSPYFSRTFFLSCFSQVWRLTLHAEREAEKSVRLLLALVRRRGTGRFGAQDC